MIIRFKFPYDFKPTPEQVAALKAGGLNVELNEKGEVKDRWEALTAHADWILDLGVSLREVELVQIPGAPPPSPVMELQEASVMAAPAHTTIIVGGDLTKFKEVRTYTDISDEELTKLLQRQDNGWSLLAIKLDDTSQATIAIVGRP